MPRRTSWRKDQIPSFLTPWQAYSYEKARRQYNDRIAYDRMKWVKRYPELAEVDEKGRHYVLKIKGVVANPNQVTLGQLKSKTEYQKLMEWMRYSKTPKYRRMRELQYRGAFVSLVKGAYLLTPEQTAEVERMAESMSVDDLIRFQLERMPDDMQTVFDFYKAHAKKGDASSFERQAQELLDNMRSYLEENGIAPKQTKAKKRKARK